MTTDKNLDEVFSESWLISQK